MNENLFYLLLRLYMLSLLTTGTLCQNASGNNSIPGSPVLRFGVFISEESSDSFEYAGFRPSLEIGFETVTRNSALTTGDGRKYQIMYNISDAMCDAAATLTSFIDLINGSKPMIMLLGSDCSVSTEPVASISHHWNLVQISQSSSSPFLSNTDVFPRFLRTVSSDAEVATGVSSVMKHFGWTRVALITQSETIFTSFSTEFKTHINNCSLRLLGEYTFTTDTSASSAVEAFQRSSARIIFLNMYEENAAEVLCSAYRRNMRYPNYVWIVHNWYNLDWWRQDNSGCTEFELMDMLNMQLIIDHYPRIDREDMDKINIGGITWNEYEERYLQRFNELFDGTNVSYNLEDGAFMYDTVWAAVLALNRTAEMGYSLSDFNYLNENLSEIIYNEALKVEFFGLTGDVTFDHTTGDRPGRIRILQYRDNGTTINKILFGKVKNGTFLYVDDENTRTVFPDGIPADEEYVRISLPLFVIYCVLAVLGVIFACICLWFNVWFRNHKVVKLSSPYVNVMIIAGAIIFYTTVILFGADENVASFSLVDGLCQARIWLCVVGFSLLFGTIFAKAWRIYYIFNHLTPNSKTEIKDIYLFGIVAVLLILDVIFMLPTTIISSSILRREEREISSDNDGELPEIIGICDSEYSLEWLIVLFIYKGLILAVGLLLAFEIRKVKIVSLNESRFIGMSVYGAVIVSIALTPIGFSLEDSPTTQYAILGIMMLASVTIILVLIFVTKMYKVYRDPEGKNVQLGITTTDQPQQQQQQPRMSFQCSEEVYKSQIQKLNGEVAMLRKRLKENNLHCDDNHAVDNNHVSMVDDNHVVDDNDVVDAMNHKTEHCTEV